MKVHPEAAASSLPTHFTSLIGREQAVSAVGHLLQRDSVRMVTLTGPGGVGKTRLGLQVTRQLTSHFGNGTAFVSLTALRDPMLVLPTIIGVLGLQTSGSQQPLEQLQSYLRDRAMLLCLVMVPDARKSEIRKDSKQKFVKSSTALCKFIPAVATK